MDDVISESQTPQKNPGRRRFVDWLLRLYIMLMIPFLLVIGSARMVMNPNFLAFEYNRANFPADRYGFSVDDRLTFGPYGVLYIINNEPIEYLADLELPGEICYPQGASPCPAFNSLELSHMEDVQVVAQRLFQAGLWCGIVTIITLIILWRVYGLYSLRLALMQGTMLTIGLVIAIVLLAVTAWDAFFGGFHGIFFAEGTWQFYYSDTLIRLYPEQFWFDASITIGIMTTGGAIAILALAFFSGSKKA